MGITCSFNPATVTPANGAASTTLTVATSAGVMRYGILPVDLAGPGALLAALALFCIAIWRSAKLQSPRLVGVTAGLVFLVLSFASSGCVGYSSNAQTNRGTASVMVTAQSGTIAHTATVAVTVQ